MSEREEMVEKWNTGLYTVSELAKEFGVSRPVVYTWIAREEADEGLHDRSSRPHTFPTQTPEAIAQMIVSAKRARPQFGPKKIIKRLRDRSPEFAWPASSTAADILDAHGLVKRRRARRQTSTIIHARKTLGAEASGEMMTIDHKGQSRVGSGEYCFPLTINEPVSRFVYSITALTSTAHQPARAAMEAVFREYGVPKFIGSDNGGPFCCTRALGGLSRLSVWWIRLGITPVRIHPGCPWENGIHERMHRTLKAYTMKPPAATIREQQKRFDEFLREFNHERPHEGLDGDYPALRVRPCDRPYPSTLPELEYAGHCEVRRVRTHGEIKWKGERLFVSETLAGERVALEEVDDGIWVMYFGHITLARYDERTKKLI